MNGALLFDVQQTTRFGREVTPPVNTANWLRFLPACDFVLRSVGPVEPYAKLSSFFTVGVSWALFRHFFAILRRARRPVKRSAQKVFERRP